MKKLINKAETVVSESLMGLVQTHSHVRLLRVNSKSINVVVRSDINEVRDKQVTLISGGGSGHEPAHVGYVGKGMLSAAVCGAVFTSPDVASILTTIRACSVPVNTAVEKNIGVLLIVKNYTGDRLNFGLAMEIARKEGYNVEMVIVGDDCALNELNSEQTFEYRRGIAGTCLVHKLVGAFAEKGNDLNSVHQFALKISRNISTIGVGLSPCVIPGSKEAGFKLGENQIEFGLGIHGEAGVKQSDLLTSNETIDLMLDYLQRDEAFNARSTSVVLLVNNLGSTTGLEMYIAASRAIEQLEEKWNVVVERVYVGAFMTALEMAGISLSLLNIDLKQKEEILELLDTLTNAIAWPMDSSSALKHSSRMAESFLYVNVNDNCSAETVSQTPVAYSVESYVLKAVKAMCMRAIEKEEDYCSLDKQVGDGDMGHSFKRGAELILQEIEKSESSRSLTDLLHAIGMSVRQMGGSSGVLLAVMFLRMSKIFESRQEKTMVELWTDALQNGVEGIIELGGAKKGDRTMVDTLLPVCEFLSGKSNMDESTWSQLVSHAKIASESTKDMEGRKGRSAYLKSRVLGSIDPGAYAVADLIEVMVHSLNNEP